MKEELSVIQKTYDFIKWYVPILNRVPRDHKFLLSDRIIAELYTMLENLIKAKYSKNKLDLLLQTNIQLEIIRYQTRLVYDFNLINTNRYEYINKQLLEIGMELGGWLKQQRQTA